MVVYVVLTEACNLACPHCIRGEQRGACMTCADFKRVMIQLDQCADVTAVVLTGGEPLAHPEFHDMLSDAFANFTRKVVVTTNGTLLPSLQSWAEVDLDRLSVQVSLDGPQFVNDSIRGAGSYKKALKFVASLNACGISPSVATTVSTRNYAVVEALAEELKRIKILRWSVNLAAPMGRCDVNDTIAVEEWNDLVDRVMSLDLPYSVNIKKLYDMSFLDRLTDNDLHRAERLFIDRHLRNCSSGSGKLYVYPDLSVYPCTCLLKFPIGNLFTTSMAELIGSPILGQIASLALASNSPCRRCRYVVLCNGGCPGVSFATFGAVGIGDSRCPRFRELANEQGLLL